MSCAARARALVPAHSCQRADNVLFWPAVTLPSFSLRSPPRRRPSPSPPRSAARPVAAAPRRALIAVWCHRADLCDPFLQIPPRRHSSESPSRPLRLRRPTSLLRFAAPFSPPRFTALSPPLSPRRQGSQLPYGPHPLSSPTTQPLLAPPLLSAAARRAGATSPLAPPSPPFAPLGPRRQGLPPPPLNHQAKPPDAGQSFPSSASLPSHRACPLSQQH